MKMGKKVGAVFLDTKQALCVKLRIKRKKLEHFPQIHFLCFHFMCDTDMTVDITQSKHLPNLELLIPCSAFTGCQRGRK